MSDAEIEREMKAMNDEFEQLIVGAAEKKEEVKTEEVEEEEDTIDDSLQKRYDFIVAANRRNQQRIRYLMKLLDLMGRKAARLGLRFDEMDDLARINSN